MTPILKQTQGKTHSLDLSLGDATHSEAIWAVAEARPYRDELVRQIRDAKARRRLDAIRTVGTQRIARLGLAPDPADDLAHDGEVVGLAPVLELVEDDDDLY